MTGPKLIQFRCQKNGHLFYFQGYPEFMHRAQASRCPFCWLSKVEATGREYPAINERDVTAFPKE